MQLRNAVRGWAKTLELEISQAFGAGRNLPHLSAKEMTERAWVFSDQPMLANRGFQAACVLATLWRRNKKGGPKTAF
ncbi:hypothetical protein FY140_21990 [Agrobacterium tumefaciens]|uniref:hypothetical protein n=1 Tax=Agrobacterium tumefaciens TaxID=358 RepID=UPI0021D24130|nr:hypothetical protein [Agrobacterium tumefaciens]UXT23351.1 hypothetical protein FY140_21990 [Agrobacterium tumefaciens]